MRLLIPLATLFLAACATTPRAPVESPTLSPPAAKPVRSDLGGLTEAELVQRFGPSSFRVREGAALKLQWQNATCILDTYLYPPVKGTGAATVLHADARRPGSGETVAVEGCVMALATR
jgi:hypothetical protein